MDALRAAGQDDGGRLALRDLGRRDPVGNDLAVDVELAHPAGDQLRVLRTEVDDEDRVVAVARGRCGFGWSAADRIGQEPESSGPSIPRTGFAPATRHE